MPSYFADSHIFGFGSNSIDRTTSRQHVGCLVERVKENTDARWEASHYFGRDYSRFRADYSEGEATATYGSMSKVGHEVNYFRVFAKQTY